ncbi:hypothetical protein ACFPYI_20315 [Halomarina salina]|uniref:Uncharacterized protein n=1 Tax=Halomarina salina TaxID=1872699 RepID=A0ABD5RTD0_9EURY
MLWRLLGIVLSRLSESSVSAVLKVAEGSVEATSLIVVGVLNVQAKLMVSALRTNERLMVSALRTNEQIALDAARFFDACAIEVWNLALPLARAACPDTLIAGIRLALYAAYSLGTVVGYIQGILDTASVWMLVLAAILQTAFSLRDDD